jgi:hypothetical protein
MYVFWWAVGSLEAVSCDGAGKSVNTDLHEIRPPPSIFCRGQVPPWHQTKPYYEHMNHHYNTQAPDEQTQIASLYLSMNTIFNLLTRRINLTNSKYQTLLPPWTRDDTTYRCNGGEIDSIYDHHHYLERPIATPIDNIDPWWCIGVWEAAYLPDNVTYSHSIPPWRATWYHAGSSNNLLPPDSCKHVFKPPNLTLAPYCDYETQSVRLEQ